MVEEPGGLCVLRDGAAWALQNDKESMDACLEEVRLLSMINARDPRDEHHIARLHDYFYHLVSWRGRDGEESGLRRGCKLEAGWQRDRGSEQELLYCWGVFEARRACADLRLLLLPSPAPLPPAPRATCSWWWSCWAATCSTRSATTPPTSRPAACKPSRSRQARSPAAQGQGAARTRPCAAAR